MDYHNLREAADSWGLLYLVLMYLAAVAYAFRPGGRKAAKEAANIPLKDD